MQRVNVFAAILATMASTAGLAQDRLAVRHQQAYAPDLSRGAGVRPAAAWNAAGCDAPMSCHEPYCAEKTCRLNVSTEKVTKTCFEVKCEAVCIPPVTFPWEKSPCSTGCADAGCQPPRCARVKYVNVPLSREYECGEKCVCKWELEDACVPANGAPGVPEAPAEESAGRWRRPSLTTRPAPERHGALAWLRWNNRR